ncbi:hypothetical protein BJV78DRAFT_1282404 [Lactifluus subvellereus]|nr:hypothetical protein BJV78DRAFT_1282404 [Lactifluus subvellereus]
MGSVCLSLAPTLRCAGLSFKEEVFALIPAGLEVIFSLGLVFAGRDAGRTRYILAAEGPTYFSLALLSLLGRIIPLFQTSLLAFKVLDIAIGAASCIPIVLYTSFLYLFKRKEFFPNLPKRFALFATAFSLAVIPIIVVTNEIGSFLGVMYSKVPENFTMTVGKHSAVGPYYFDFQFGREFLGSTSLALLTIYQAITFLIFFSRLAMRITAQRNIEDTAASDREGVLFRGIGWLSIGMKIGAVEAALGFASTDFVIVLGLYPLLALLPVSNIRIPIRHTKAHSRGCANRYLESTIDTELNGPADLTYALSAVSERELRITCDVRIRANAISAHSRVTVVYGRGRVPTLVLNLSPMELPSGNTLAAMSVKQSSMGAFDNVGADLVPPSPPALRTAPLLWVTPRSPALLAGPSQSNEKQLSWDRGRFHSHSSRRRTTPRPTSAVIVRASIVPKLWGDLDVLVEAPPPQFLRKDSDSGLSADDPARRRRTTDTHRF